MNRSLLLAAALTAAFLTGGCARRVVFTTHTSLGLDVSGTAQYPNKVSFSFNRYEGALVPMKTDGEAHSVYGGMDADMTWFHGHAIAQTFATGKAAQYATGATRSTSDRKGVEGEAAKNGKGRDKDYPLVFFTGTTYGLHLTAGESQMSPNLLVGYRRSEATVIPVTDPGREVRSVYADISIATTASAEVTTNFSAIGGVRIKQSFATGAAADTIAKRSDAKAKLDKAAGFDRLAKSLAQARADAATLGGEVKTLVAALPDPKLNDAVDALLQSGLPGFLRMDEAEVKSIKDEPAAAEKRRQLSEVAQDLEGKEAVKLLTDYRDRLKAL